MLSLIKGHVESDAGLKKDNEKLLAIAFDFAIELGFHILCLFPFFFLGLRLLTFKTISSKGFVRIMAKILK